MMDEMLSKEELKEKAMEVLDLLRSSESDLQELGRRFLSVISGVLNIGQGLVYLREEDGKSERFVTLTSYACPRTDVGELSFKPGEGLVGQVAMDGRGLCFHDVPNHYMTIVSGLGKSTPASLAVLPLKYNEKVEGVIELASFSGFSRADLDFLAPIQDYLGMCCAKAATKLKKKAS